MELRERHSAASGAKAAVADVPLKILIVDDSPKNLLALEAILESLNQVVVRSQSAREALKCLIEEEFAVILLDVHMPDIDGLETARLIRRREKLSHVPIIFLTAYDKRETDLLLGYSLGAVDYIMKPIVPDILRSKVSVFVELARKNREIAQHEEQLRHAYGELELRIQERTADLAQANEALKREIEERHNAQKALARHTGELERLNRDLAQRNQELDDFSNAASHDLQEPLRKMIAFSELLCEDAGKDLPDRAMEDLKRIVDSAHRMQALVRGLLALSHSGRGEFRRERLSLKQCAEEAIATLTPRIEELQAHIEVDTLPEVDGDNILLTQLYQNLIGNALKFAHATPRVWLTSEQRGGQVVLGVKDNGIGIEPKYQSEIFSPFRRLHGRSEYEGTGIGLSICRKVVERHGGRIWVESEPGKGAHFRFTVNAAGEHTGGKEPSGQTLT